VSSNKKTVVAESYPPDSSGSSPLPPELPGPPPERRQFSVAAVMLFTLACAGAALGARLLRVNPAIEIAGWAVAAVFLLYVFWRLWTVILRWGRWRELQRHRQDLAEWADSKRESRRREATQPDRPGDDGI
jgi:hypothetical protein